MIDVIIPAYNAHKHISKALYSILSQSISDKFNVYIVNDCSDKDYNEEIKNFKKYLKIKELKTPKNIGPGGARQFGIDNSSSEYIIFLDSDDLFNDCYSVRNLYNFINDNNYDAVTSNFVSEKNGDFEYKYYNDIWMHGKMYRRSFLEKYNIRFNNTRSNEDTAFNRLISLKSKFQYLNVFTYIWQDNKNSITRRNNSKFRVYGLEGYFKNMAWVAKEAKKRKFPIENISTFVYEVMIEAYYNFINLGTKNKSDLILEWSYDLKKIYDKYKDLLSDEQKTNTIYNSQKFIGICGPINYLNNDISFNKFLKLIDKYNKK